MTGPAIEAMLSLAQRHRKVINYYNWVLGRLTMPEAERLKIEQRIVEEQRALSEIGRLAGLPLADSPAGGQRR